MNQTDLHGRGGIPSCACKGRHTPQPILKNPCICTEKEASAPAPSSAHAEETLAMAFVRIQSFGSLYDPCTALIAGTLFADLDKPFCGDTVSASAYPTPPARTCACPIGCGTRGGLQHG